MTYGHDDPFAHLISSFRSSHSSSNPSTAWFSADSVAEKPLWSVDQPVNELTSFDDFGVLSLGRGVSTETISTIGEKSFLDHLLKSGSASNVHDLDISYIPTTVDSGELGGRMDLASIEQLEMLQSEGYDVSAVIEDLRSGEPDAEFSVSVAENVRTLLDQRPTSKTTEEQEELDTDLPYLMSRMMPSTSSSVRVSSIPFDSIAVPTRRRMSELERASRIKQYRTDATSVAAPSNSGLSSIEPAPVTVHDTHTSPIPFPLEAPSPSTSTSTTLPVPMPLRFDPPGDRVLVAEADELMDAVYTEDASELRSLLHTKRWPESGFNRSTVFDFIVEKSLDTEEALMFFRDYATSNRRNFVADKQIIALATRAVEESGVSEAKKILALARNMFISRAPQNRSRSSRKYLEKLYNSALSRGSVSDAQQLLETVLEKQFDNESELFLRSATAMLVTRRESFSSLFSTWSALSIRFGSNEAVDLIWECALKDSDTIDKDSAKEIGQILSHSRTFDHPFSSLAEMICAYVRLDKMDQAAAVFSKVSISGRHFRRPLSRLMSSSSRPDDITDMSSSIRQIEGLADLVSRCMYGERRRGGRRKTEDGAETAAESKKSALSASVTSVLEQFYGVAGRKPQTKSPKKTEKRKLHRVDEEQLHELSENLQDAWITLALRARDVSSAERCLLWSQKNRVNISEKTIKKVDMLKTTNAARDCL